jgi:2-oxoglutarate ferredoxin oxidoreductase subunit gamma
MLGAFASLTDLIPGEALKKSLLESVPKGTEKLNLEAFERGFKYGKESSVN